MRKMPFGEAFLRNAFRLYVGNAARKNMEVTLTFDEFKALVVKPCHYCGGMSPKPKNRSGRNGVIRRNGLDRINNKKGYTIRNVVPCCSRCNSMKSKLTKKQFIEHIKKIKNHLVGS